MSESRSDAVDFDWNQFPNPPWFRPVAIHDLDLIQRDVLATAHQRCRMPAIPDICPVIFGPPVR